MLRTFDVPFHYHQAKGGQREFIKLATTLGARFDTAPQIIDTPVFSYCRVGRSLFNQIAELDASRPAIVFLSNVVMHSALMVIGDCDTSDLQSPLHYDSIASFLRAPHVRGYHINEHGTVIRPKFDDTTIVISDLARFRNDNNQLPDDGLFRVLHEIDDVFVCNVLDYDRYFAHYSVYGDQPFFLPSDADVDFKRCVERLDNYSLREFLLEQSVPFATLGDDHVDDEYAVSYGMDCWNFNDDKLAFAR